MNVAMLSQRTDDLERLFKDDEEVALFSTTAEGIQVLKPGVAIPSARSPFKEQ